MEERIKKAIKALYVCKRSFGIDGACSVDVYSGCTPYTLIQGIRMEEAISRYAEQDTEIVMIGRQAYKRSCYNCTEA